MNAPADICVVVPAFDAAATIARAVASALAEPEVGEVIVVDDASRDATAAAARAADDGTGRLSVLHFERNRGPSAARNAAIASSRAAFVAILDADDYLLPGRFAVIDRAGDWELMADNIAFVPEGAEEALDLAALHRLPAARRSLGLAEFLDRNISRTGRPRSELGFLKPLIRRAMLDRLGLGYDEDLRLGEDFILYATAMARGARFELSSRCGYVAVERAGSLSGRHRTADLAALAAADRTLADELVRQDLPMAERRLLGRHIAALDQKVATRAFIDRKLEVGLVRATAAMLASPRRLARASAEIIDGKLRRRLPARPPATRMLFDPGEFAAPAAD